MSIAITAAGRRRQEDLEKIVNLVDESLAKSAVARREALEILSALTTRSEQNHIAAGVALAFSDRMRRAPRR